MRRPLNGAAGLALTTVAVLAGSGQAQADGSSWAGCPCVADGALAETCKSLTTDCHFTIGPQEGFYADFTPINSIMLRELCR
ncbi:hypothetical protein AB0C70_26830 [Streptomyces sp. NPDC048564]|uniref:hypothetical protein n=1 Tax=Streptomyces sp. NPDC048564 TaxID=3155760 RepID=UPI003438375A